MKVLGLLNMAAIVIILLFLVVNLSDLAQYMVEPADYRFGTEVAGFRYTSSLHFVASAAVTIAVGSLALAAPLFCKLEWSCLAIRVAVALAFLVVTTWAVK